MGTGAATTAGSYPVSISVTNANGTASSGLSINVAAAPANSFGPTITSQPLNIAVSAGQSATFAVEADANPSPTYQWKFNGSNIANATGYSLNLTNVTAGQAGNYSCLVQTPYGSVISNVATLSVAVSPILRHPQSQTVAAGSSGQLTVNGAPGATYQWQFNGADIPGATGSTLLFANTSTTRAGTYTVVVSTVNGSVTSSPATVTVNVGAHPNNISTRAFVGTGADILDAGFVVSGSTSETVLIRADGPALSQFDVTDPLATPSLVLYDRNGAVVAANLMDPDAGRPSLVVNGAVMALSAAWYWLYLRRRGGFTLRGADGLPLEALEGEGLGD